MGALQDPEGSDKKRIHVHGLGSVEGVRASITSELLVQRFRVTWVLRLLATVQG